MIGYLDTAALVPLLVNEPTTPSCQRFWNDCDTVVTNRIAFAEASAALAMAERLDRIRPRDYARAITALDGLWYQLDLVEVDDLLVHRAGELARRHALRGYDAVHCASAELLDDPELVAATGDGRLLAAWTDLGIDTYDTAST